MMYEIRDYLMIGASLLIVLAWFAVMIFGVVQAFGWAR